MKRVYIVTAITCLALFAAFLGLFKYLNLSRGKEHVKVGFIYDNDESTPYTYNFSLAKDALEKEYGDRVEILTSSNVIDEEIEAPLRNLADQQCDIIFFNGYSEKVVELAPEYPGIQFCQTSYRDMTGLVGQLPSNYHTFKGEAYQGRYVSGIAAGYKIRQLIQDGVITEDQAKVGFVAAFSTSEVISGYTAFLLGVRSVVPTAVMEVSYTNTWSSYPQEKRSAQKMIEDGCVVISQHTDTIGPAIACEEAFVNRPVYFVGYNQTMSEVAPAASLVTSRICWEPYVLQAVDAVMKEQEIESLVSAKIVGTDAFAGFEKGWVELTDLNEQAVAPGTQEALSEVVERFRDGEDDFVFRGSYVGVDPENPSDTLNLQNGYIENETTSYPTFHYLLSDIITVVE